MADPPPPRSFRGLQSWISDIAALRDRLDPGAVSQYLAYKHMSSASFDSF